MPIKRATVRRGGGPQTRSRLMKPKIYRLAFAVAMLAVIVESLGAGAKW
jgi:hypothetical protein